MSDVFHDLAAAELERERKKELARRIAERAAHLQHRGKLAATGQHLPATVEECKVTLANVVSEYGFACTDAMHDVILGRIHDLTKRLELLAELQKGN